MNARLVEYLDRAMPVAGSLGPSHRSHGAPPYERRCAYELPRRPSSEHNLPSENLGVGTFENQSFRASGLSLLTAAIVHWNTIYLDLAVQYLRAQGVVVPDESLAHVAPLGWEHIALTGDYDWNTSRPLTDYDRSVPFPNRSPYAPLSVQF